jgi:hypothetical protein
MAHVRWAAGSAMTALDLCAAAIGELHSVPTSAPGQVHDIASLGDHRNQLCAGCNAWRTAVVGNNSYRVLKNVRDPMTHKTLPRRLSISTGAPTDAERLALLLHGARHDQDHTPSRTLIEQAQHFATSQILALIEAARDGKL